MSALDFYEVVAIGDAPEATKLGVAGATGVVTGISEDDGARWYAVLVGDRSYFLPESALSSTGRSVDRDEIYSGESLHVDLEGSPLDPPP